jgi:hypothetical protein
MADPVRVRVLPDRRKASFWVPWSLFVLAGVVVRAVNFHAARSLWLDEAMLALNVAARSFSELLRPLDYNQVAPPLFLWIERLAVVAGGPSEQALRAWPTAAGMVLPAVLGLVAYRLVGTAGGLAATALAALSPTLVWYANEAKPYGSDAFVTVALLAVALAVREEPGSRGRWIALAVSGIAGLLLSIPAAFVSPAVLLALWTPARRAAGGARWLVACAVAWAAALALVYVAIYAPAAHNPHQQDGYDQAFLTPGPRFAWRARLALEGTIGPTFAGGGSAIPPMTTVALAAGAVGLIAGLAALGRRAGPTAAVLAGVPLLLAVLASALRRYPLGVPRMMVFAAPLLILMAAGAVAAIAAALRNHARAPVLAAAGLLCLWPLMAARAEDARHPARGEDGRALVAAYRDRPVRQEPIYVAARAIPSWLFYTTNWENPDRARLAFYAAAASNGPSFENAPSRGRPVSDEGLDLVYGHRGHEEILGLATGRHWRWPSYVQPGVDEGWAANEARRIAQAANPCAWAFFTHVSEKANKPLASRLRADHGGRVAQVVTAPGGVLYRFCLPRTAQQQADLAEWKAELAARQPSGALVPRR